MKRAKFEVMERQLEEGHYSFHLDIILKHYYSMTSRKLQVKEQQMVFQVLLANQNSLLFRIPDYAVE